MSSIAQDANGNIALGYSIAGSSKLPSLRVTARLASDPLGLMTYGEKEIGTGLSENMNTRWGDYSHMVVDPVDDRTFWFCGEYMTATDYSTKVFKFRLRRDTNDLSVNKIVAPVTSNLLSTTETIIARVSNPGHKCSVLNSMSPIQLTGATPVMKFILDIMDTVPLILLLQPLPIYQL